MGQKIQLKDKDGTLQYPVTSTALVVDPNGKTVEERLQEMGQGGAITLDGLLDVEVSDVQNGEFLMYEEGFWVPQRISTSSGSTIITVDSEMSSVSANPVQNKVIKKYVDDAEAEAKQYTDEKIAQIEIGGGGISQENADKRYIRKVVDNFDSDLTFAIADGIVGTDDEYYFIPAKAPSTASDSQILATKEELNTKQDIINDLDTIRSGAAKGETAIQKVKTINGESIEGEGNIVIKGEEGGLKYVEERTVYISKMIADGVEPGSYELSETEKAYNIETLDKAINERSVIIVVVGYIFQFVYSESHSTERIGKFSYVGGLNNDLLSASITINQDGDAIWEQKVLELGEGGETDTSNLATKEELNNLTNEVIANEEVHAAALNDLNERLNNISDSSSEDLVTFYLLGGGAVQDDTTKALNKQAYEAFWAYDEVPMVNILMVVGESNSKNDGFEALCPTAMAGAPNEDLLFIASPYRLTISPDGNVTLEAADIPDEVTIDDAMSDTSENAVQNKVIKQYVDEKVGNIDFSSLATKEEVQKLTDEIIANEEVHAAALNDLNERKADKDEIAAKQDTIADLDTIRNGAALGATALQSVPSEYSPTLDVLKAVYPVGAIYISTVATSPQTLFGFGTWERIQDRFLLSAGSSYDAGSTGGEATHTLTTDEMPSHKHTATTEEAGSHTHTIGNDQDVAYNSSGKCRSVHKAATGASYYDGSTGESGAHTHNVTVDNTGSGAAHNNMPPYLAVYMWKRTA